MDPLSQLRLGPPPPGQLDTYALWQQESKSGGEAPYRNEPLKSVAITKVEGLLPGCLGALRALSQPLVLCSEAHGRRHPALQGDQQPVNSPDQDQAACFFVTLCVPATPHRLENNQQKCRRLCFAMAS